MYTFLPMPIISIEQQPSMSHYKNKTQGYKIVHKLGTLEIVLGIEEMGKGSERVRG